MVKYNLDTINKILESHGFVKNNLNKLPTWMHETTHEGLQINLQNEIVSFVANHGEKDLTIPDSELMQRIKREIHLSNEPIHKPESPKPEPIKQHELETKDLIVKQDDVTFVNQIHTVLEGTRMIVPQDFDELKAMSVIDRMLLFQRTPTQFIKYLDKKKQERPYVEGNIMKMEANIAFMYQWSSKIDGWHLDKEAVACYGSIKVCIDGKNDVIISGVGIDKQVYRGGDPTKPSLTVAEMMKNANTDLKKKCLADLGFNNDVYRNDIRPDEETKE